MSRTVCGVMLYNAFAMPNLGRLLRPPSPDEGFRQEVDDAVRLATLALGGLQISLALIFPFALAVIALPIGVATVVGSRLSALFEKQRALIVSSSLLWLAAVALLRPGSYSPTAAAAIVICVFALLPQPFLPAAGYAIVTAVLCWNLWPVPLLAATGVVFSPIAYEHRRRRYESQLLLLQHTQDLRLQQERALAAEHAASLERLAAAMSHELNTPMGAMRSSVQTLRTIIPRYREATGSRQQDLAALHADVCECLLDSTTRAQSIVSRLQRLTSLDRAAVRPTDINVVLQDVTAAVEASQDHEVAIRLNLHPLPEILCETQAWTTILMRLITNAVTQPGQRIVDVSSEFANDLVTVEVIEVGREADRDLAASALDPAFTAVGGRVGTSNWGLFQIRGWIRQLGGDLRVSNDAAGIKARLTIPAQQIYKAI